jgi:protocatechuate 3,4-dioxygenase beta subunit
MPDPRILRAPRTLTRRSLLRKLGTGLAVAPLAHMFACTDDGSGTDELGDSTDSSGSDSSGSESGSDSSSTDSSSTDSTDSTTSDECGDAAAAWASGGTAAMTGKDCYPDPFVDGVMTCALLCSTTEGPCTADTIDRQDVSEGWSGLPVRLALKFVHADDCSPVEGAVVEIWHTQRTGVYSGVTPSGAFCYGDDPDAENYLYFRGSQTTDAEGRIDFDTCYPGWYSSRAIHIHFRVYLGDDLYLTSQLFFSDELNAEIFSTHPEYSEFGQPDTTNTTDNVIGGEDDLTPYLLDTQRMTDGAMLAWKVVAIRSSLDQSQCAAQGSGMGGPP